MKTVIACNCVLLIMAMAVLTCAYAMTPQDFQRAAERAGIDRAVVDALAEGMAPAKIVEEALKIKGMKSQAVLAALCKAGVDKETLAKAAEKNHVPEVIFTSACRECSIWKENHPLAMGPHIPGHPGGKHRHSEPYTSQSRF